MLQPGDLIFVRGRWWDPIADAIKFGELLINREDKLPLARLYTHVAVYLGGNNIAEAQGLRVSGTGRIGAYAGEYDIGHVVGMTYDQRQQFLHALTQENGYPYDWVGIFWLAVKAITGYSKKYEEHKTRYCSTYVGWALRQAGIVVNDETPSTLALDPRIHIEVVGKG
ncbi:hypothetical protein [Alicyclobacillus vulcanalis]|uniref:Permuted papain-like amidase enzyme, YaeF/YiiX, C92 family n=1 Tax=Alicyclobacillus vulcanalis TaxID=252246 RepID=A0A1N7MQF2_9BACL|nr:hypothetical protein [Alicyclobacillus vulcanalis]SIS88089.1 hypothetical protein SAMN05421799_10615 [Alicyclobacillus vulcanalis]